MGFKRTREEVCESLSGGMCDFMESEVLSVFYETTPEAVKELLPPGLLPYKRPLICAGYNIFHKTNFEVPYLEAALYVAAVHEKTGLPGFFVPAMTLNVDMGTILGRELGGYPKKAGRLGYNRTGNSFVGFAERHGIPYYTVKAEFDGTPNDPELMAAIGELLTPPDPVNHPGATIIYNYLWPASSWVHLKDLDKAPQPILTTVWKTKHPGTKKPEIGKGEVIFQKSENDPWYEFAPVKTLGAIMSYDGLALDGNRQPEDEYPVDAKEYLPYAFYSYDVKPQE